MVCRCAERLGKIMGYYCESICSTCGGSYEGMNGNYEVDGIPRCINCIDMKSEDRPYFVQHIPAFVDGGTRKIYTFYSINNLTEKLTKRSDGEIYVYDGSHLMTQSIKKKYWWVLGTINNFDLTTSGLPKANYGIYNNDETVNNDKIAEWLGGGIL